MSGSKLSDSDRDQQSIYHCRHRHDPEIIARLEEIFKECSHPDETRRRQIGEELGLDAKQVKFWFQNKKTQLRTKSERLDINALRLENERIQSENRIMSETLKTIACAPCGGRSMRQEERELYLQILKCERVVSFMANNGINPELLPAVPSTSSSSPLDTLRPTLLNQTVGTSRNQPILNHEEYIPSPSQHNIPAVNQDIFNHGHNQEIPDLALDQHVSSLTLTVTSPATVDPFRSQDDPLLISCLEYNIPALVTALDQNILSLASTSNQNNINLHVVEKQSQGLNPCLNVPSVTPTLDQDNPHPGQDISSILQDHTPSLDLDLDAILHILNSDVVSQPKTSENKDTENARMLKIANNAMEELMKLLSMNEPFWFRSLVDERFVLQRDCYQRIFQRSNSLNGPHARVESSKDSRVVKMSGTELVEMFLNSVSWVEHVEVDDKIQTHHLFRDLICGNNAYGAERWVLALERMCERIASASAETIPRSDVGGVIRSPDSRRNILRLTRRMVKSFCESLCMQDNTSFPHLTRMNNGAIRVAIRVNMNGPGEPKGMLLSAATSFWLPISPQDIFDYLIDDRKRAKWDVLCSGNAGHEIQRITTGSNPGNCVSIMRPFIPKENNIVILQESYVDALGSMMLYAPFDMKSLNYVMNGEDTSLFPILPSGFTISRDAKPDVPEGQSGEVGKSEGSLVTLMFQILASSPSRMSMVDIEFVSNVNALVTSTIEHIKDALNCSHSKLWISLD
ncbi:hypothetical protein VIGAN_01181500 [Vigna angularis var. angularis]|uniref:Homeobox domain-containing protein n=1 Tax=Vigna angularis var. angularis TaxID=157739 RepID=A0A0S3R0P7_PHAAN|nr:hypothetical protein VIGAN_01181500 [Vigna angularis var. angularis]